jgi:hypothetical protein
MSCGQTDCNCGDYVPDMFPTADMMTEEISLRLLSCAEAMDRIGQFDPFFGETYTRRMWLDKVAHNAAAITDLCARMSDMGTNR